MDDFSNDNDSMVGLYESSAQGVYLPPVEAAHKTTATANDYGDPMSYFSSNKTPQPQSEPEQYSQPQHHQVINEAQQNKNYLLTEALNKLQSAHPHFQGKDREYLKEIREAIEELIE